MQKKSVIYVETDLETHRQVKERAAQTGQTVKQLALSAIQTVLQQAPALRTGTDHSTPHRI
jgi:hypothetical protein